MALLLALLLSQAPSAPVPGGQRVDAPATWVAFSAELKITHPTRPLAFGRQLQDEHGCMRRETVHPDGSLIVSISNYETATMYSLIRGMWTKREIRLIPGTSRRPPTRPVGRLVRRIDGFDAYRSVSTVRSSRGDYRQEYIVIPALNFFIAEQTRPTGETIVAQNIRLGPVDHSEFLPPAGAAIADRPGFGRRAVQRSCPGSGLSRSRSGRGDDH